MFFVPLVASFARPAVDGPPEIIAVPVFPVFPFPTAGDLRWRESFRGGHKRYVPLIRLRDGEKALGDAVVYAEPKTGGRVLWTSALLGDVPETELLLADAFDALSRYLTQD